MLRQAVLLVLSITASLGSMIVTAPDADAQLFRRLRAQRQAAAQAQYRQRQPAPNPQQYNQQRYNRQRYSQQQPYQARPGYPATAGSIGNRAGGQANVPSANYPSIVAPTTANSGTVAEPTLAEKPEPAINQPSAKIPPERADNFGDAGPDSPASSKPDENAGLGQSILSRSDDTNSESPNPTTANEQDTGSRSAKRGPSATMGLNVFYSPNRQEGVRIAGMTQRSMADESGLRIGDLIVEVDNQRVRRSEDLAAVIRSRRPGMTLPVKFVRNSSTYVTRVPLIAGTGSTDGSDRVSVAKPPTSSMTPQTDSASATTESAKAKAKAKVKLGMMIQDSASLRGTMVTSVRQDSIADVAGMKQGDRIVSVEGKLLENGSRLRDYVSDLTWGDSIALGVVRDGELISRRIDLVEVQPKVAKSEKSTPSETPRTETESSRDSGTASAIGKGIGSMLGGLFGNSKEAASDDSSVTANQTAKISEPAAGAEPAAGTTITVPPEADQSVKQVSGVQPVPDSTWDPLGFGDDEPIEQSIFQK